MKCAYCDDEVDQAAEFFDVTHHKPWANAKDGGVFCSYECLRGYLHAEHFKILHSGDDTE